MSALSNSTVKKTIRTTVFIDRSNRISESVFFHLSSIPITQHPEFIREILYNHLGGVKNSLCLQAIQPSQEIFSDFSSGLSVVVSFGSKEMGFADLYKKINRAGSSHERRIIVSQLFFDALLESQDFSKLNPTDTNDHNTKDLAIGSDLNSGNSAQSKSLKQVNNF
jgi:hypothetical protein